MTFRPFFVTPRAQKAVISLDGTTVVGRNGTTGAILSSSADAGTVRGAVFASLATTGGDVYYQAGVYPQTVTPDFPRGVPVSSPIREWFGAGAIVQLQAGGTNQHLWNIQPAGVADYTVYSGHEIYDAVYDLNNLALGLNDFLGAVHGGSFRFKKASVQGLHWENVRCINVLTDWHSTGSTGNRQLGFELVLNIVSAGDGPMTMTDITWKNIRVEGGNQGGAIGCLTNKGTGCYYDNINLDSVWYSPYYNGVQQSPPVAVLQSDISLPLTNATVTVDTTNAPGGAYTGFPSTGSFIIENKTITYTGLTGTTFTTCNGGTGGTIKAGALISQIAGVGPSAGWQVGALLPGGIVRVKNHYAYGSNDVWAEYNNYTDLLVEGAHGEECRTGFLLKNFSAPLYPNLQAAKIYGLEDTNTIRPKNAGGFISNNTSGIAMGRISVNGYKYRNSVASFSVLGEAISVTSDFESLDMTDVDLDHSSITHYGQAINTSLIDVNQLSTGTQTPSVTIRGRAKLGGSIAAGAGAIFPYITTLGGPSIGGTIDLDSVRMDITGMTAGRMRVFSLGISALTTRALRLRAVIDSLTDDTAPVGVNFTTVTINDRLTLDHWRYLAAPAGFVMTSGAPTGGQMAVSGRPTIYLPTYGATTTPDMMAGELNRVVVTNGTAFTLADVKNPIEGLVFMLEINNASGGAMGAVTFNGAYNLALGVFVNPVNGKSKYLTFVRRGAVNEEIAATVDI